MSEILSVFDSVLTQARRLQKSGQPGQAIGKLSRLLELPGLPAEASAEAHARLGELYLERRRFRKSRRHLRAALSLAPDSARLHQRLAHNHACDPAGKPDLARRHYRRALELEPNRARWRADAGLLAVRQGDTDGGLALLRQARQHAPEDAGVLGRLVRGLCAAGNPGEALRLVRLARFGAPQCLRLRKLEGGLLLGRIRREQDRKDVKVSADQHAVLLPFLRPEMPATNGRRIDKPQTLAGPHLVKIPVRVGRRSS